MLNEKGQKDLKVSYVVYHLNEGQQLFKRVSSDDEFSEFKVGERYKQIELTEAYYLKGVAVVTDFSGKKSYMELKHGNVLRVINQKGKLCPISDITRLTDYVFAVCSRSVDGVEGQDCINIYGLSKKGSKLITKIQGSAINYICKKVYAVLSDTGWYLFNSEKNVCSSAIYQEIEPSRNGFIFAKYNNGYVCLVKDTACWLFNDLFTDRPIIYGQYAHAKIMNETNKICIVFDPLGTIKHKSSTS